MRKDDLITVTIEDLSSEGLGVGHYAGMAFFITIGHFIVNK